MAEEKPTTSPNAQIILITQDGCPYCEQAINDFKKEITSGEIEVVNVKEDRGKEILNNLHLTKTPACVLENKDTKTYDYCSPEEKQKQES